ncbi:MULTISPECIES: BolA family protein [Maricaulis]|jgi:BolA protein|uniref:Transcriptional regulator, BolA protein family n=1 Tax=Maricaulis maris (strain MCS10) TaxID=394221 RepID=Q0AMC4_MARMM|nr:MULTISPECIES: BolA family protein [Maricaulis]ABI66569.1 transcriptional regulator, BolA protein family [Maricaulis maris MCS10]MAC88049.1 BolA family transcriptional regulator [Maricaulis sp.]
MVDVAVRIETKLQKAFTPSALTVTDDSHLHAGHAGARPGGESHFTVDIVASRFDGLSRVACHRLVNEALAEELAGPVHALVIRARGTSE